LRRKRRWTPRHRARSPAWPRRPRKPLRRLHRNGPGAMERRRPVSLGAGAPHAFPPIQSAGSHSQLGACQRRPDRRRGGGHADRSHRPDVDARLGQLRHRRTATGADARRTVTDDGPRHPRLVRLRACSRLPLRSRLERRDDRRGPGGGLGAVVPGAALTGVGHPGAGSRPLYQKPDPVRSGPRLRTRAPAFHTGSAGGAPGSVRRPAAQCLPG
jgi:hypothetical protein